MDGKRVAVRIRVWECPFCGDGASRVVRRTALWEKPMSLLRWVRRCQACGHRYYTPLWWCLRPGTWWALVAVGMSALASAVILWRLSEFASPI